MSIRTRRWVVCAFAVFAPALVALAISTSLYSDPSHQRIDTSTVISLREYVDIRFEAQEKAVQSALAAADRAVQKAESATEKRFEGVNEFRASLADNSRTLMPRAEAEQQFKALAEKTDAVVVRLNTMDDRARGSNETWGYIVGLVGMAVAILTVGFRLFISRRPG